MSMQWILSKPDTRTPEQREKDRLEKIEWQKQVKLQREKTNAENRIKMRKQIEEWAAKCKAQKEEREMGYYKCWEKHEQHWYEA